MVEVFPGKTRNGSWASSLKGERSGNAYQECIFLPADNRGKQPQIAHDEIEGKCELSGRNKTTNQKVSLVFRTTQSHSALVETMIWGKASLSLLFSRNYVATLEIQMLFTF